MLGELSTSEIEALLHRNVIGRVGMQADGKVYVVPITYVYDGGTVLGHTTEGLKIELLRKNPHCCFEVDEVKSIAAWQSVIAWGRFEELSGNEAAIAMEKLSARLLPLSPRRNKLPGPHGPNRLRTYFYANRKFNCL
ncbi:MAG: pyridoxamine 5'-phosphate oxidase family protein [Cyclobacteriaceae bacterium]|nr:pyridoxamine 5'-phosphate oxidase family protein [Cyclobacteriaceae bacterium]